MRINVPHGIRRMIVCVMIEALLFQIETPDSSQDQTRAVVLYDSVQTTVLALNELRGMKITGCFISITPCPKTLFDKVRSQTKIPSPETEPRYGSDNTHDPSAVFGRRQSMSRGGRGLSPRRSSYDQTQHKHISRERRQSPGGDKSRGRSPRPQSSRRSNRRDSRSPPGRSHQGRADDKAQSKKDSSYRSRSPQQQRDPIPKRRKSSGDNKADMATPPWATDRSKTKDGVQKDQSISTAAASPGEVKKKLAPQSSKDSSSTKEEKR